MNVKSGHKDRRKQRLMSRNLELECKVVVDKSVCGLGGGRFGHDHQPWRVASLMSL